MHLKCLKLWQKHALMDVVGSNRSAKDRAYRCSVCNSKFSIRPEKGASPLPHSPPLCGNSCVLVLRLSVRRERGYSASYATFIIYRWRARVLAWECPCSLFLSHCRSRLQHRRRPSVFVCLCVCVPRTGRNLSWDFLRSPVFLLLSATSLFALAGVLENGRAAPSADRGIRAGQNGTSNVRNRPRFERSMMHMANVSAAASTM